ncbi:MAG: prepilin-type N-terminal cleavage/methylation domain-containing protein, partial [Elusimicrobiales bacterium]|nr:prepilin-type N-terminal cleavage/methylation domain-containing protein [Elusimicrobiales bacterium]
MRKGFTLIELLVVVLIIGILSAVALPQYTVAVEKSRVSEALINGRKLAQAQYLYFLENGDYGGWTKDALSIDLSGGTWADDSYFLTKNFIYRIEDGDFTDVYRVSNPTSLSDQGKATYSLFFSPSPDLYTNTCRTH